MKKSKFLIGAIFIVVGIIGILGLFSEIGDKVSLAVGSVLFLAVGVVLIYQDKRIKSKHIEIKQQEELVADKRNESKQEISTVSKIEFSPSQQNNEKQEEIERKKLREEYVAGKRNEFEQEIFAIPKVEISVSQEHLKRRAASDMPEIHFSNITKATRIDKLFPLVVLDVETTGFTPRGNDIIEVSAIKYDVGFHPVSCFTTLLKSRNPIPAEASAINHITDDMIADCPPFSSVARSLSEYISGCNIVGHNVSFDLKFLFVCGADLPSGVKYFDTLQLAQKTLKKYGNKKFDHHTGTYVECEDYDVENYKLETLCEYYSIYRNEAHRSLSDSYATGMLLKKLIEDKTSEF